MLIGTTSFLLWPKDVLDEKTQYTLSDEGLAAFRALETKRKHSRLAVHAQYKIARQAMPNNFIQHVILAEVAFS